MQAAKALEDFAESVRNDFGSALPKDGTVAESTSNVILFLEHLVEYADTAGAVLRKNHDSDNLSSMSSKQLDNTHKGLLGFYISKILEFYNL